MRTKISVFTTVAAATLLAIVTVFIPNLPTLAGPVTMSLLVVVFSAAWPFLVSATPRWQVSAALAVTGLAAVWVVALLPSDTVFTRASSELWLAPIGGAAALGVLLMFVIQTFTLPGGMQRFLTTAVYAMGAVIAATSAGWTLLLRNKYEVAQGALGVERISGVTWLMLTILVALAVAALGSLVPGARRNRMIASIVGATAVAIIMQVIRPGVLSVPAVIAGAVAALIVALAHSFSTTRETPRTALTHPMTAIAVGSGTTIVTGMVSYFVIHALPW